MPISTTIDSTNAMATSTGPHTNAIHSPPTCALNCWKMSTMAASSACSTGTTTSGTERAVAIRRGSRRLATAKNDSSQKETNTIDRWNGQNFHACVTSAEYSVSVASDVTPGLPVACAHRIDATRRATAISGATTQNCT